MRNLIFGMLFTWSCIAHAADIPLRVSPAEGIKQLVQGNERYVKEILLHPNRDQEARTRTAIAQKPFAIVLGCSDSRVPPEVLFDQGIGDLFIVRVAGNVVGPIELASIGYAALYLGASSLIVLGHQNCGAIKAVLSGDTENIEPIARLIAPAVKQAKTQAGSQIEDAVKDNVKYVVNQLEHVPLIAKFIKEKKFAVVGGYYGLATGKVELLTPVPIE